MAAWGETTIFKGGLWKEFNYDKPSTAPVFFSGMSRSTDACAPDYCIYLDMCDETSFWCWHSKNLGQHEDAVRRMRDFIGPEKSLLMGVYMWDYTLGQPVPADRMEMQLAFARRLLREKVVTGLIFHPTYSAALDVPAVNLAKKWIRTHGEDIWGT